MSNILDSIFIFFSTNIDFLILLVIVFSHIDKKQNKYVNIGYYLGTFLIIFLGLIFSNFTSLLPAKWMIGFLGFIPLFIGLKMLFSKDNKQEIGNLEQKIKDDIGIKLILFVIGLTLIAGGDNFGVFVSFFANTDKAGIFTSMIVFVIMTYIFLLFARLISIHPAVESFIEKYEHVFVPFVFILLGIFILNDSGLIKHILSLII